MKTEIKILIAVIVVIILIYVYSAYTLQFQYGGFELLSTDLSAERIAINVTNNSPFSFPVPAASFNVYDGQGNYLGLVTADSYQWINARSNSVLNATVNPNTGAVLTAALTTLITGLNKAGPVTFKGKVQTGVFDVPVEFEQSLN